MFELGLKLLVSYLLGSVNGALLLGQLRGIDIRGEGSGNAGATNALRTHGWKFALAVVLIDVGKGVLSSTLVASAAGFAPSQISVPWLAVACGFAAVVGHCYPIWYGLRGGKGAATAVGALAPIAPLALIPLAVVWLALLIATGYVGLATVSAAATLPLVALLYRPSGLDLPLLAYGFFVAALIAYAHRSNIANLRAGTEHRMHGAMFWRRRDDVS